VDSWKCDLEWWITLYHVAVQWEGFGVTNAWRMIPASMCSANCEIWRRLHYSVGVFYMVWSWPSRNTAQKYKRWRIQGHFDPLHTAYSRRPVRWWRLYQHDSAPYHKAGSVREWFVDNSVPEMDWPAQSPDLNPIEHLWDELECRLHSRPQCPTSLTALQEEWATIPP
jgi:hypothetical protein